MIVTFTCQGVTWAADVKQQKIARKLKYLTTDTDYDELAKELSTQEPGEGSPDPFADIEASYSHDANAAVDNTQGSVAEDDLDEYAKWAAEAAAKATSGEMPAVKAPESQDPKPKPMPRKPIPMPMPAALKPKKA